MENTMRMTRKNRSRIGLLGIAIAAIALALPNGAAAQFVEDADWVEVLKMQIAELEEKVAKQAAEIDALDGSNDRGTQIGRPSIGLGVTAGASSINGPMLGGHVVVPLQKNLHVGAQVGLSLESTAGIAGGRGRTNSTSLLFSPYTKLFFPLEPVMKNSMSPFLIGGLSVERSGSSYSFGEDEDDFGVNYGVETNSSTSTSLYVGGGAEFFVNRSVGIYGYVGLFEIDLDDGKRRLGLLGPRVGIEWFLF